MLGKKIVWKKLSQGSLTRFFQGFQLHYLWQNVYEPPKTHFIGGVGVYMCVCVCVGGNQAIELLIFIED